MMKSPGVILGLIGVEKFITAERNMSMLPQRWLMPIWWAYGYGRAKELLKTNTKDDFLPKLSR